MSAMIGNFEEVGCQIGGLANNNQIPNPSQVSCISPIHQQTSVRDSQVWPQSGFCKSSRRFHQARLFPQQWQIWQWKKKNKKTTETNKPKLKPKHVASQNLKLAGNPAELRNCGFRSSDWQERLRLSVLQRRSNNNCERLSAALSRQQQRANPWAERVNPSAIQLSAALNAWQKLRRTDHWRCFQNQFDQRFPDLQLSEAGHKNEHKISV